MTGVRAASKVLGAMTLIVGTIVVPLIVGAVVLWRGPLNDIHLNGADQSVGVRSAAESWSGRAMTHLRLHVTGRPSCTIPPDAADPHANYFPVTCTATTTSGTQVRLASAHAGIQAFNHGDTQYLSGPWHLRAGAREETWPCLPSTWRISPACPAMR